MFFSKLQQEVGVFSPVLDKIPDISFAAANPDELIDNCVAIVEKLLGRTLARADPLRIFINALVAIIIQQRIIIDETAKMNLLAYSKGVYLDHLGALVGVERLAAGHAVTTVEVTLSAPRLQVTAIDKGTRVTADNSVFFQLDETVVFNVGEVSKSARAVCISEGTVGNGYAPGEINRIVDQQPFLLSIVNTTKSEGGTDVESDDAFRERIQQAPESFSVAGSEGAYIFHAKSVSPLIADVAVDSPQPGFVDVYVLLEDGTLPSQEILSAVNAHLNAKTIRPLTDSVSVKPPVVEYFDIDVSFWISREDSTQAATIVEQAQAAVEDFISWQKQKLGRDLNPSELIARLMKAGVKRCNVFSPSFKVLNNFTVAVANDVAVTFGGLEDN